MSSYSCRKDDKKTLETHTLEMMIIWNLYFWDAASFGHSESDTDLVFRQVQILHVTLVWFAVGQLPQLLRRPLEQLAPDLFILAPVGEVVRREAAVVQAVNVGAEVEEATHQCGVLEIYGQVEGRPSTALFLQETTWKKIMLA